jgi:death-on-curing protein
MTGLVFLAQDLILAIHEEQLAQHGGGTGIRDVGLLESALTRPLNALAYNPHIDKAGLAASYAFVIAKNHPFIDGNERTAYLAKELFLALNGVVLASSDEESLLAMLALASGEMSEDAYADWIRAHFSPALPAP